MKKVAFLLSILSLLLIYSCDKDSDDAKSFVEIEVKENGVLKSGVTVYMFTEQTGPVSVFFSPFHSHKSVVTNDNGVAKFELEETIDLNPVNSQTTFYYGVFNNNNSVLGTVGVTIKKGETKRVSINY